MPRTATTSTWEIKPGSNDLSICSYVFLSRHSVTAPNFTICYSIPLSNHSRCYHHLGWSKAIARTELRCPPFGEPEIAANHRLDIDATSCSIGDEHGLQQVVCLTNEFSSMKAAQPCSSFPCTSDERTQMEVKVDSSQMRWLGPRLPAHQSWQSSRKAHPNADDYNCFVVTQAER